MNASGKATEVLAIAVTLVQLLHVCLATSTNCRATATLDAIDTDVHFFLDNYKWRTQCVFLFTERTSALAHIDNKQQQRRARAINFHLVQRNHSVFLCANNTITSNDPRHSSPSMSERYSLDLKVSSTEFESRSVRAHVERRHFAAQMSLDEWNEAVSSTRSGGHQSLRYRFESDDDGDNDNRLLTLDEHSGRLALLIDQHAPTNDHAMLQGCSWLDGANQGRRRVGIKLLNAESTSSSSEWSSLVDLVCVHIDQEQDQSHSSTSDSTIVVDYISRVSDNASYGLVRDDMSANVIVAIVKQQTTPAGTNLSMWPLATCANYFDIKRFQTKLYMIRLRWNATRLFHDHYSSPSSSSMMLECSLVSSGDNNNRNQQQQLAGVSFKLVRARDHMRLAFADAETPASRVVALDETMLTTSPSYYFVRTLSLADGSPGLFEQRDDDDDDEAARERYTQANIRYSIVDSSASREQQHNFEIDATGGHLFLNVSGATRTSSSVAAWVNVSVWDARKLFRTAHVRINVLLQAADHHAERPSSSSNEIILDASVSLKHTKSKSPASAVVVEVLPPPQHEDTPNPSQQHYYFHYSVLAAGTVGVVGKLPLVHWDTQEHREKLLSPPPGDSDDAFALLMEPDGGLVVRPRRRGGHFQAVKRVVRLLAFDTPSRQVRQLTLHIYLSNPAAAAAAAVNKCQFDKSKYAFEWEDSSDSEQLVGELHTSGACGHRLRCHVANLPFTANANASFDLISFSHTAANTIGLLMRSRRWQHWPSQLDVLKFETICQRADDDTGLMRAQVRVRRRLQPTPTAVQLRAVRVTVVAAHPSSHALILVSKVRATAAHRITRQLADNGDHFHFLLLDQQVDALSSIWTANLYLNVSGGGGDEEHTTSQLACVLDLSVEMSATTTSGSTRLSVRVEFRPRKATATIEQRLSTAAASLPLGVPIRIDNTLADDTIAGLQQQCRAFSSDHEDITSRYVFHMRRSTSPHHLLIFAHPSSSSPLPNATRVECGLVVQSSSGVGTQPLAMRHFAISVIDDAHLQRLHFDLDLSSRRRQVWSSRTRYEIAKLNATTRHFFQLSSSSSGVNSQLVQRLVRVDKTSGRLSLSAPDGEDDDLRLLLAHVDLMTIRVDALATAAAAAAPNSAQSLVRFEVHLHVIHNDGDDDDDYSHILVPASSPASNPTISYPASFTPIDREIKHPNGDNYHQQQQQQQQTMSPSMFKLTVATLCLAVGVVALAVFGLVMFALTQQQQQQQQKTTSDGLMIRPLPPPSSMCTLSSTLDTINASRHQIAPSVSAYTTMSTATMTTHTFGRGGGGARQLSGYWTLIADASSQAPTSAGGVVSDHSLLCDIELENVQARRLLNWHVSMSAYEPLIDELVSLFANEHTCTNASHLSNSTANRTNSKKND